jgi:hypothetical protein
MTVKGTASGDFLLQVSFMDHPPANPKCVIFGICSKIREGAPKVPMTPVAIEDKI